MTIWRMRISCWISKATNRLLLLLQAHQCYYYARSLPFFYTREKTAMTMMKGAGATVESLLFWQGIQDLCGTRRNFGLHNGLGAQIRTWDRDNWSLSVTCSSENVYFTFTIHCSIPDIGRRLFVSPKCPNLLWISPKFLFERHREHFPRE